MKRLTWLTGLFFLFVLFFTFLICGGAWAQLGSGTGLETSFDVTEYSNHVAATYLPLDGSVPMTGDLNLDDIHGVTNASAVTIAEGGTLFAGTNASIRFLENGVIWGAKNTSRIALRSGTGQADGPSFELFPSADAGIFANHGIIYNRASGGSIFGFHDYSSGLIWDIDLDTGEVDMHGKTLTDAVISGHLLPVSSGTTDLGSAEKPWKSLYVSESTIYFVGVDGANTNYATLSVDTNGNISAGSGTNPVDQVAFVAENDLSGIIDGVTIITNASGKLVSSGGGGVTAPDTWTFYPVRLAGELGPTTNDNVGLVDGASYDSTSATGDNKYDWFVHPNTTLHGLYGFAGWTVPLGYTAITQLTVEVYQTQTNEYPTVLRLADGTSSHVTTATVAVGSIDTDVTINFDLSASFLTNTTAGTAIEERWFSEALTTNAVTPLYRGVGWKRKIWK